MQDCAADGLIAANVLAGDPGGRAELYDRHAAELYDYCLTMLRDERAIAALTTTLMIATGRLAELPDPSRLRPWLFALARDECRRRARSSRPAGSAGQARAATSDAASEGGTGNGDLFAAALASLGWDDREVIALCVRHRLIGADLADVLGRPADRVRTMLADARVRLQRALGALFVARTGRADCPRLARTLNGWDGRAGRPVIGRIRGHIGSCATCRGRELRELPSWELRTAGPGPRERFPLSEVRPYVLSALAVGGTPAEDLIADLVKHRTGTFGAAGFPDAHARDRRSPLSGRRQWVVRIAGAGAGVAAAAAVIVMFAALPGSSAHTAVPPAGPAVRPARTAPSPAPSPVAPRFVWLGSVVQFATR